MRHKFAFGIVLTAFFVAPALSRADLLTIENDRYEGTINGIRNGKLSMTIKGTERQYDLDKITTISLDALPKLADAEAARADEAKKAVALYKALIPTINKPETKLLVQWRAIDPTDRDGQWSEALTLFLEVYQAAPSEAVWNGRPSHWPGPASRMLTDGADRVAAAIKAAKSDEVKKNLRKYLLDIYTKAGNTQEAQRLAREIETGITQDPIAVAPAVAPDASGGLIEVTTQLAAKNYARAAALADAQLETASGETAAQLYALKAQALEAQNKPADATAAWLRLYAHYSSSPSAPAALLSAARLEKKLNDIDGAKALLAELVQKYPDTKEAAAAQRE